ncbi:MAG: hypothetical protein Q7U05_08755 [Polaromonas sp.]|nr:hypothetical protein [Polaromonas sp.]
MAKQEGFYRLAKVIRGLGVLMASLMLLLFWGLLSKGKSFSDNMGFFIGILCVAAFFYVGARALAWVIEGFASDK